MPISSPPVPTTGDSALARGDGLRQRQTIDHEDEKDGGAKANSTTNIPYKQEVKRRKTSSRPKSRSSFWRRITKFAMKRRWPIPLAPLLTFALLHVVQPSLVSRFIFLSYKTEPEHQQGNPALPKYGKGPWDIAFVSFYTLVLSFTREFIMQEALLPLARHCGIVSRAKQLRFMEQMYTVIYFGIMGPAGLYIMRNRVPEVWYFNTRGMYEAFPHKSHDAAFKFYYLFQATYWAQQAIVMVLGLEKPRKDFKELVVHHIVTLALIALSYRFHFAYMGIVVYVTHDVSDLFLAVSSLSFPPFLSSWVGFNGIYIYDLTQIFIGREITTIRQQSPHHPRLCALRRRLDISTQLHQPAHSVLSRQRRVSHRRALRAGLGDGAVQVLDFECDYIRAVGVSAGVECVLVVLFDAEFLSVFCVQGCEG